MFCSSDWEALVDDKMQYEHDGEEMFAEDMAEHFAFLPEFHEPEPIDVEKIDIGEPENMIEEKEKMRLIIKKYIDVFKDGGNALPPPARDVGDSPPIAQKA